MLTNNTSDEFLQFEMPSDEREHYDERNFEFFPIPPTETIYVLFWWSFQTTLIVASLN